MQKKTAKKNGISQVAVSRRNFLKTVALTGGAMALGGVLPRIVFGEMNKYGGTLKIGVVRGLRTLNPVMHISGTEWLATQWIYNNLTRLNSKREVIPDLAESWVAGDNARVWQFQLRKGVKFHVGREVTAEDVVATIQKVLDPNVSAPYAKELGPIEKVEAVGKYAVKFTLESSYADFPVNMTVPSAKIIAREGLEDFDALAAKEYGTGPFKIKEFVPGDHLIVERFDDYFKKGLPYLDQVVEKVFPEASTEVAALEEGEIDMIWEVPPELYAKVATTKGVDGLEITGGTISNVIMPSDKPPFDDNRVRDALKYTVDRNLMLAAVLSNRGEILPDHPISKAYRFYSPLPERPRDIDKAKQLLKEAGHSSGLAFKLYAASSPPLREKIAVVLKEMAKPAGFDIDVEVVGYDRYLSQIWNKGVPYIGFYGTRPTADAILMKLYTKQYGIDEGRWAESHQEQVAILEKAREIVDFEARKKLYAQFCKISKEEGPFIIPFARGELSAKKSYVKDYRANPTFYIVDLEETWLSDDAPQKKA